MTKNDPRKALGKGLHSLLPTRNTSAATAPVVPAEPGPVPDGDVQRLPIEQIASNPNQPRREFDAAALMELTQSIERDGIIQPIIVRRIGPPGLPDHRRRTPVASGQSGGIEGSSGNRSQCGRSTGPRARDSREHSARGSESRSSWPMAFQRMATELGLSHDQIGQKTGKERTTITNSVRLLQLPRELQTMIASKQLSAGHARALLKFDDEQLQREIAERCIDEGWSVRQIEQFTRPEADGTHRSRSSRRRRPSIPTSGSRFRKWSAYWAPKSALSRAEKARERSRSSITPRRI